MMKVNLMKHKVYIVDSNILLCLVESNKHSIIGNGDEWNKEKIEKKLNLLDKDGETVAIPLPMMIETSNIIGHDKKEVPYEGNLILF